MKLDAHHLAFGCEPLAAQMHRIDPLVCMLHWQEQQQNMWSTAPMSHNCSEADARVMVRFCLHRDRIVLEGRTKLDVHHFEREMALANGSEPLVARMAAVAHIAAVARMTVLAQKAVGAQEARMGRAQKAGR